MSEGGSVLGVEKLLKSGGSKGKIMKIFKFGDLPCYKFLIFKVYNVVYEVFRVLFLFIIY